MGPNRAKSLLKPLLALAAVAEALTGLLLLVAPALLVKLLFGVEVTASMLLITRPAGIALISLGIACWPGPGDVTSAARGMIAYSLLATVYFVWVGIGRSTVGALLWPAAALHAGLTLLLIVFVAKEKA